MKDRQEPTISGLPLDRDDGARARAQNTPPSTTNATGKHTQPSARPRSAPTPVSERPVVVRSKLAPLAFLVALAAGGFAGYVYWLLLQSQEQLTASSAQLASAEARITELEQRLMLSDDESTQSMTVIQAKVKENASEIRKLWGVAYDRNRKSIADLEAALAKVEKSVAGVDGKIKSALNDVVGEVKVLSELVDAQQALINSADQSVKQQAVTIKAALQKLDGLDGPLRKQVKNNAEAIEAIDAFRLQVNRELIKLKGG